MRRPWLLPVLISCFVALWCWAAWEPTYRFDWFLENILVFICVPALVISYRWFRFTDFSYVLLFVFVSLHVVGSHWTYANVPWPEWRAMGFPRNEYDRVVHFSYGFLLFIPVQEVIAKLTRRNGASTGYFALEFILATSALYEIMEWVTALIVNPAAADAFLGQQGDGFDSVADMAMAGLGGLVTYGISLIWLRTRPARAATVSPSPAAPDSKSI